MLAGGGIEFGVYYSLIDGHFPQAYPISSHNADPITPQHFEFNMNQVREIMTNYGDISEIWFDMGSLTLQQSKQLYELVDELQPNCMISGRLGNDYVDFSVMADNEYPIINWAFHGKQPHLFLMKHGDIVRGKSVEVLRIK